MMKNTAFELLSVLKRHRNFLVLVASAAAFILAAGAPNATIGIGK